MNMLDRPTRDQILMGIAELWSGRSTCSRTSVGVVICHNDRPISSGYNGAPMGMPHCEHRCDCGADWDEFMVGERFRGEVIVYGQHHKDCFSLQACKIAVHAEVNAIAFAARHGTCTEGASMYTTTTPCVACAQLIINCGISLVVYRDLYRDQSGLDLLRNAGVDTRLPIR